MMRLSRYSLLFILMMPCLGAWAEPAKLADVLIPNDPEALKRGAQTAVGTCMGCHNLKYLTYHDLLALGFTKQKIDEMRAGQSLGAALISQTPPESSLAAYGKIPPDLSLMAKARDGGPRYIYTLLTSFYQDSEGNTNNRLFSGIKMPDILGAGTANDPAARHELQTKAAEVAAFLNWAADPHANQRRHLGYYVIGYLIVLTGLLYLLKRRIWRRLAPPSTNLPSPKADF